MVTDEIQVRLDEYHKWLRDSTQLRSAGDDWAEVTTPFLDRHNDCLQIYVRQEGTDYLLTDEGYVLGDLASCGVDIEHSPRRRQLLHRIVAGFGVELDGQALRTRCSATSFAQRKHGLLQAMLAVDDLSYLAGSTVTGVFAEDVGGWLRQHRIRATERIGVTGRSGLVHHFDFAILASEDAPERLVRAIRADRYPVELLIQAWQDTREIRPEDSELYAILNDSHRQHGVPAGYRTALETYGIQAVPWSERDSLVARLAA